jgi:hypothetical protein
MNLVTHSIDTGDEATTKACSLPLMQKMVWNMLEQGVVEPTVKRGERKDVTFRFCAD